MPHTEQLWPGGPLLTFDEHCFAPSTDSFLLSAFPALHRGERVCDLGAGAGLLGALLLSREPSLRVTGIELEEDACRLCGENARRNHLSMTALRADLRQYRALAMGAFDLAISNPPYFTADSGAVAEDERGRERSELTATLGDICAAASWLLAYGGRFALVYRPERLVDLFVCCRANGLEPKRLRFVQHSADHAPSLVLLECKKGGRPALTAERPLVLYGVDGRESEDVRRAYFRDKE